MKKLFLFLVVSIIASISWANSFKIENFNFKIISSRTLEVSAADKSITEADIPASVTYNDTNYVVTDIREGGFANCSNLTSITIPNTVSYIGDLAFANCKSLKVIKLYVEGRQLKGEDTEGDDEEDDNDEPGVIVPPCSWCGGVIKIAARNFAGQEASTDIFYGSRAKVTTVILGDGVTYIPEGLCQNMFSLTSIDIPKSVTSIEKYAFYDCSSLASITLPDDLNSIGERAFYGCTSLKSIIIPDSVTNIDDYAFERCTSISSVNIGKSVVYIGDGAFDRCNALKSCKWSATKCGDFSPYYNSPFYDASSQITSFVFGDAVEIIPANLCNSMYKLQSVEIPNSVTNIGKSAFELCNSLTSLTIGNNVTSIGDSAFSKCWALTSVKIPNSVISVGEGAFFDCYKMISLTIGNSVTSIGDKAFFGSLLNEVYCYPTTPPSALEYSFTNYEAELYVPCDSKLAYESDLVFGKFENIKCLDDGNGGFVTTHIHDTICQGEVYEFGEYLCDTTGTYTAIIGDVTTFLYLTVLPQSTDTIIVEANDSYIWHDEVYTESGEYKYVTAAANGCDSIEVLYLTIIPSDNPDIAREQQIYYYSSDGNIVNPTNPNGFGANIISNTYENGQGIITFDGPVTNIGESAFSTCSTLTNITIPNTVKHIGSYAFETCFSLNSIIIPNGVETVDFQAFGWCNSLESITIPSSVTYIGENLFAGCDSLASVMVDNQNPMYDSRDNCNAIIETATNTLMAGCKNTIIPNTVKSIGNGAFRSCYTLSAITIPSSVSSIGESAFDACFNLKSITIPKSVNNIGYQAFAYTPNLAEIIVESGNLIYDSRESCNAIIETATNTLIAGCKNTAIPNTIEHIGAASFMGCQAMTAIDIPEGVKTIGEGAFLFCHQLSSISIPNSVTLIGGYAFYLCSSLTSITIPENITNIGARAFQDCEAITSITWNAKNCVDFEPYEATVPFYLIRSQITTFSFGDKVEHIPAYLCYGMDNLSSITIPKNVTSIGERALAYCAFDTIYSLATTPPILKQTFANNDYAAKLLLPCEAVEAYKAHEVWGQFENVQCIEEEQPQADNLYYRYVMNADNTVLSEILLTQESFDKFTTISLKGDQQWTFSSSYGATMNGNSVDITYPNEDWLISPALDLAGKANAILSFEHCFGPASAIPTTEAEKAQYTIWVSNDFTGDVQSATWTQLNGMMYGTAAWKYVSSGNIEIPANYLTENCRVAWKYVCEDASAKWEIKNVLVTTPTNQVEVVAGENKYSGDITIPATTIFNGSKCDVVGIAEEAFYDCSALISITIPNSMKHIGEYAFRGCYDLAKTNFMGEIADWCDIKFGGAYANPMSASKNLYINNQEVKDLVIPNTVDSIHAYAFDCGNSITSVALPNSVVYIGEGAFYRTYINEIIIPKSVTSIEERVLSGCNALTSIIVEDGNPVYDSRDNSNAIIETNSNTLTAGCVTTDIPNTIMHIGPYAFSYLSSLKTIEIPNSVITIGDYAFYACSSLKSFTIPNSVSHIGYWALYACYSLNSIVVEEGNSVYDSRNNCNAIIETATNSLIVACQNTVIPEGVTNIGENAFFNCDALINSNALTSIVLPNTIESIEAFAFSMCSSLDTIYCYAITPPTTNQYAFGNYNATLYVPCESLEAYKAHEVWGRFNTIQCLEDPIPDPTERVLSCAEAVIVCLETGATATTEEYTIHGYVTEITTEYSEQYKNISFYMADTKDGGQVLFTYRIKPMYEADIAVKVGDFVEVVGKLVNYNGYLPEVYPGVYTIVNEPELPTGTSDIQLPTSNTKKVVKDGQLLILRDGKTYNVMGQEL